MYPSNSQGMDAPIVYYPYFLIFFYIVIIINPNSSDAQDLKACGINAIYQLGDSISDTGNAIQEFPGILPYEKFPFGMTIKTATGRPSDGLLMIDYFAQSAGLPLLEPYENPSSKFNQGVDFSVAGVTAVPVETLLKWNIKPFKTNSSLTVQALWFSKHLSTLCKDPADCKAKLNSSLFVVGTIGFNDYNLALSENRTIEEIRNTMVPGVVQAIIDVVKKMIWHGATRVIVPGAFQMGCTPGLLTIYSTNTSAVYDKFGCLKDYNDFFIYHNNVLQAALNELKNEFPNVKIIYGDLYAALQSIIENLSNLGYKSLNQACCGTGGKYNFTPGSSTEDCGSSVATVCSNPAEYVFWDGGHFTHQANKDLSEWLIKNILPQLQCTA